MCAGDRESGIRDCADQFGRHTAEFETFGHSAIVDPWGTVLAMSDNQLGPIAAEIDLECLQDIRRRLPVLLHRRKMVDENNQA